MHNKVAKNIKVAFFLNLIFSIIEFIGGILTNSISIISDSVHDLGDAISIGISYLCEMKAKKRPNNKYTFGYLRFSLIGALTTSIILLIGSIIVLYNAIPRLINPVTVNYNGMLILAVIGTIINGIAAYRTAKGANINEKAINLHLLEDVFGWIAVLIGSLAMRLFNLPIIDPILSIILAVYILLHVFEHLKEIIEIFLEKIPEDVDITELKKHLKEEHTEICDIHHVHVWTIDGITNYLTMHLVLNSKISREREILLKNIIKEDLNRENIKHITIEIGYNSEDCKEQNCKV